MAEAGVQFFSPPFAYYTEVWITLQRVELFKRNSRSIGFALFNSRGGGYCFGAAYRQGATKSSFVDRSRFNGTELPVWQSANFPFNTLLRFFRYVGNIFPVFCGVTGGKTTWDRGGRTQSPDFGTARHPPGYEPAPGVFTTVQRKQKVGDKVKKLCQDERAVFPFYCIESQEGSITECSLVKTRLKHSEVQSPELFPFPGTSFRCLQSPSLQRTPFSWSW